MSHDRVVVRFLRRQRKLTLDNGNPHRATSSAEIFRLRLHAYLQAFERNGVKTNAAMAYYDGGGALLPMARSKDGKVIALYNEIARWMVYWQHYAESVQALQK